MCGIVGYVGPREASPILLSGLSRLEYRGYDSAGLAVVNNSGLHVRKLSGRVGGLQASMQERPLTASCGIAHTRWATHGAPTDCNAHPHTDCEGRFAVVHNGIIENADVLRKQLKREGHTFKSATDTEVLSHLIERSDADALEDRVLEALSLIEGTFGIAVVDAQQSGTIVAARRGSPVLLGIGDGEVFVASDASAIIEYTRSVVYLDDGDLAILTPDSHRVIDAEAHDQAREVSTLEWDIEAMALGEYDHFMQKEIHEQPEAIEHTLRGRLLVSDGDARLNGLNLDATDLAKFRRILLLGCGTSWHAGMVGRHAIESLAGIPVDVDIASESRYRPVLPMHDTLAIAISQSGETADTLEALKAAKRAGATIRAIVNVVGSTIAREAGGGLYLHAGPEVGVASTKAFTCQVVALTLIALWMGRRRGLSAADGLRVVEQLAALPDKVRVALELDDDMRELAPHLAGAQSALFLGRGPSFPVGLEGALKLKEVSYVHAEGYPAAEMKHGPIALVDENLPVIFVAPKDELYQKTVSNIQEVKARGGRVIAITSSGNGDLRGLADHQVSIPAAPALTTPVLTVIPLQLLAYHVAVARGCNVDRPRNLAKSVTVE
jgi:glucosamine--fructose-6-phosphate aminotransferase (isomerizing)